MGAITELIPRDDLTTKTTDELNEQAAAVLKLIDDTTLDDLIDEYVDAARLGYEEHILRADAAIRGDYYMKLNLEIGLSIMRKKKETDDITTKEAADWFIKDLGPVLFEKAVAVGYADEDDRELFLDGLGALGSLGETLAEAEAEESRPKLELL